MFGGWQENVESEGEKKGFFGWTMIHSKKDRYGAFLTPSLKYPPQKEKKKTKNQVIKPTRKKKRKLAAKKSGGKKQHQQQAGSNSLMKGIEEVQLTPNTFPLIQCHQLRRDSLNFSDVYLKTR